MKQMRGLSSKNLNKLVLVLSIEAQFEAVLAIKLAKIGFM